MLVKPEFLFVGDRVVLISACAGLEDSIVHRMKVASPWDGTGKLRCAPYSETLVDPESSIYNAEWVRLDPECEVTLARHKKPDGPGGARLDAAFVAWRQLVLSNRRQESVLQELRETLIPLSKEDFIEYARVTEDPGSHINR